MFNCGYFPRVRAVKTMPEIRPMAADDLPLGMSLTRLAGWNQSPADWRRFLRLAPEGCFVGCVDGTPLGTAAAFTFGRVGWIAMILVHPDARGRGLGTALTAHALRHLEGQGVATIRLDATALGQPIYESLGFEGEYGLHRYEGLAGAVAEDDRGDVRDVAEADLDAIGALDSAVAATDRRALLAALHREGGVRWLAAWDDGRPVAYAALRPGRRAWQLGPAAAREPALGRTLANRLVSSIAGQRLFVDIPEANPHAVAWADELNLNVQRPFLRMCRGQRLTDNPTHLWASSGPEKG